MDIDKILQQIENYYENNRGGDAERLMQEAIVLAVEKQDDEGMLKLLNELMGYYRETGQVKNSYAVAKQVVLLAKQMGLEGTIPYATTLLNVANAYRAGGRLEESLQCYNVVREIYDRLLPSNDMLFASLENNLSLLYQEMGDFTGAKKSLLKALSVAERQGAGFETAVTYSNLAVSCMELNEQEEAYAYAVAAISEFKAMGTADSHYSAALSALGTYYYQQGRYQAALESFRQAMEIMERSLGRNEYYYRLRDNMTACKKAMEGEKEKALEMEGGEQTATRQAMEREEPAAGTKERIKGVKKQMKETERAADQDMQGLVLSQKYFEAYGKPMLEECFPEFLDKIAVGLVGRGSDCFGYDDALSRDHDWGPGFCIWVTEETYAQIGEALQRAYSLLPEEFMGYKRTKSQKGYGRRGVMTVSSFYHGLLQASKWEDIDWRQVEDSALSASVNGQVFADKEGVFSQFRNKLMQGYPEAIRFLKIAESAARFSQTGQYNFSRQCRRGDFFTAQLMLSDCIKEAMKLQHYIEGKYPPHDKWLLRSLQESENGKVLSGMLLKIQTVDGNTWDGKKADYLFALIESIAEFFARELYQGNWISDADSYLDAHTEELLRKSAYAAKDNEKLVKKIAELEFEAFDKVRNEGGRASCQNDWATFSIMRKSQYLTWNRTMLLQYLYDFYTEYHKGHNLIEEKYGRMMENTAPAEYEKIKEYFPVISPQKKAIIEQIVRIQVDWMEEFSARYPHLAENARSVRSAEDNLYNTSYETYLRGEISTYSDKMLELYGRYVVEYSTAGKNLTFDIMENSVRLYGYDSLEAAERILGEHKS